MLNLTEDKSLFTLKGKQGAGRLTAQHSTAHSTTSINKPSGLIRDVFLYCEGSLDLPADQQIGSLLTSEKRQLELCLHKTVEFFSIQIISVTFTHTL